MLRQRLSRCFHQSNRCHLSQMPSPIYQLVYELRRPVTPQQVRRVMPAILLHLWHASQAVPTTGKMDRTRQRLPTSARPALSGHLQTPLKTEKAQRTSSAHRMNRTFASFPSVCFGSLNLPCLVQLSPSSLNFKSTEQRPVYLRLFSDARSQFKVVLCSANRYWSRNVGRAYKSLNHLCQLGVWWATADGQWDINSVWQEGIDVICVLRRPHKANRRRAESQTRRKEEN